MSHRSLLSQGLQLYRIPVRLKMCLFSCININYGDFYLYLSYVSDPITIFLRLSTTEHSQAQMKNKM